MSANVEAMVREGIAAYKEGRKDEARALLTKATELDQFNEQAWLYLSGVVEAPEDQRICLENVLSINPLNEKAKKGLAYLDGEEVSFEKPKPTPAAKPPVEMPTSVEWDSPSEPSTAARTTPPPLISDDEYDSWVTGLNLPGSTPNAPPPPEPAFPRQSAAFDDDEFVGTPFTDADFGDDLLDGPFKTQDMTAPPPTNDPVKLRVYDFGAPAAVIADAAADGAMFGNKSAEPQENRRDRARREKEEKRVEREKAKEAKAAARANKKAPESTKSDDDLFGTSEISVAAPAPSANRDYTLFDDMDADADGNLMEEGEGELFGMIPTEIKASRLPGTRERLPLVGIVMLVLLLVLNVGAFGWLVKQLIDTLNSV